MECWIVKGDIDRKTNPYLPVGFHEKSTHHGLLRLEGLHGFSQHKLNEEFDSEWRGSSTKVPQSKMNQLKKFNSQMILGPLALFGVGVVSLGISASLFNGK